MKSVFVACSVFYITGLLTACNSDVPVSATTNILPQGFHVVVTRAATHPFLARFNLELTVSTTTGCAASSELFPDTGGVSRRNLYISDTGLLYLVGQFDVRRFDAKMCRVELLEFRALERKMTFFGSFDVDRTNQWTFIPVSVREERSFEKL